MSRGRQANFTRVPNLLRFALTLGESEFGSLVRLRYSLCPFDIVFHLRGRTGELEEEAAAKDRSTDQKRDRSYSRWLLLPNHATPFLVDDVHLSKGRQNKHQMSTQRIQEYFTHHRVIQELHARNADSLLYHIAARVCSVLNRGEGGDGDGARQQGGEFKRSCEQVELSKLLRAGAISFLGSERATDLPR